MTRIAIVLGLAACLLSAAEVAWGQGRPAPSPSRYGYSLQFDLESLPKGVKLREVKDALGARFFISNASETPLVINEKFQGDVLIAGTKLAGGKVYQYFPNGVPMEGKTHLKGWQAPFGDIPETLIFLPQEPEAIYKGRQPGLGKELPPAEPFAIPAKFDGKPHELKGTIQYHLNDAYDAFYKKKP